MLKQTAQLKLGQHLTMTPALQQAIRLLQLSSLDLQQEIQTQLNENIMLEIDDADISNAADEPSAQTEKSDPANDTSPADQSVDEPLTEKLSDNLPDELATDSSWEDSYDIVKRQTGSESDLPEAGTLAEAPQNLASLLLEQLQLERFSDRDRVIALTVIDCLDRDGYLQASSDELLTTLRLEFPLEPVEEDELESVIHRIQRFEPLGVACRSLDECLRLQLQALATDTPWRTESDTLLSKHFDLLSKRDYVAIARTMKLKEHELSGIMALVRSLDPRPGSRYDNSRIDYIAPDVYVDKDAKGQWGVRLSGEARVRIRVNADYEKLATSNSGGSAADRETLKNHLQEARWFIKSLQSRNETLMKVAHCIVERQRAFFDYGEEAMKPMVLREVADAVEMHESTISRVTTQKYMHTPYGILEFKYFFSSHVGTSDGGECSATAIQAMIKKLVAQEPAKKPLSDSKIAANLEERGINVARRTIAKYREALGIPSSSERKQLA